MEKQVFSKKEIEEWIVNQLAAVLNTTPDTIGLDDPLTEYGLESIEAFSLSGDLSEWLNQKLSPTLIWDYPTISQLANHLASLVNEEDLEAVS